MGIIIGITGSHGAGKDTVGLILSVELNAPVKKFSIIPNDEFFHKTGINFLTISRVKKEKYRQQFINYCERKCKKNPKYWVNRFDKANEAESFIITDVYKQIERDYILSKKGIIIQIKKKFLEETLPYVLEENVIINNGSYPELIKKVQQWLIRHQYVVQK